METMHHINILVHVTAGTIALLTGLAAIIVPKSSRLHKRFGHYFTWMMGIILITGLIGVFHFKRNNFLLVITLLSGYNCFSGIRAIQLHGRRPAPLDYITPLLVLAAAFYYLYYIINTGMYWSPVVTYATIGTLFTITSYDLLKSILPLQTLQKAVLYEHTYKMISAFSGIVDAFSGTVFPQYQPYSQILPSAIGLTGIIITFIWLSNKHSKPTTTLLQQPY